MLPGIIDDRSGWVSQEKQDSIEQNRKTLNTNENNDKSRAPRLVGSCLGVANETPDRCFYKPAHISESL